MPKYRKAIVSYLDILGFRDLIGSPAGTTSALKVHKILAATRNVAGVPFRVQSENWNTQTEIQNFSDLILRTTFIDSQRNLVDQLFLDLGVLAGIQFTLVAKYGIFVRGGVSIGDMFIDSKFVFGPALVRAYELSEKVAVFPRIVVDPELVEVGSKSSGVDFGRVYRPVLFEDNNIHFVDYLGTIYKKHFIVIGTFGNVVPTKMLVAHKRQIEKKLLETAQKEERIRRKIGWAAMLHNRVIVDIAQHSMKELQKYIRFMIPRQKMAAHVPIDVLEGKIPFSPK